MMAWFRKKNKTERHRCVARGSCAGSDPFIIEPPRSCQQRDNARRLISASLAHSLASCHSQNIIVVLMTREVLRQYGWPTGRRDHEIHDITPLTANRPGCDTHTSCEGTPNHPVFTQQHQRQQRINTPYYPRLFYFG